MSKPSFAEIVKNRGFNVLWANQILMQLAINALNFSLIIWVYKLTGSNLAVSLLLLFVYLPALIFGIASGVLVDRTDKRKLIILLDLLLAAAFFVFPFIRGVYPLILLNTFFINTVNQFFTPAEGSSIPLLVKKDQLFVANSLFTFTLYGSFMVGFTAAGPILSRFSISPIFNIGGVLMVMAAAISTGLPTLKVIHPQIRVKLLEIISSETKETLAFIKGKLPVAAAIGLLATIQGIIGILAVVVPSYMERVLRVHATDASIFLMLPLGLGMISGALIIGRFFSATPRRLLVIPAIIVSGILLFGLGIAPSVANILNGTELPERIYHLHYFFNAPSLASTFALGAFLVGLATVSIVIPSQTTLQESTTDQNRGKILAVLAVLMNAFAAVPVVLAGILSDLFGVRPILMFLGIVVFAIGLAALSPDLVFAEEHLPLSWRQFLGLGHWEK